MLNLDWKRFSLRAEDFEELARDVERMLLVRELRDATDPRLECSLHTERLSRPERLDIFDSVRRFEIFYWDSYALRSFLVEYWDC